MTDERLGHRQKIKKIRTVLVANRGDPVIRAVKTLQRLQISTAVFFSEEDAGTDWVAGADYAYPLENGEQDAKMSANPYLNGRRILELAKKFRVDAIWPGWGFLSENADFAREVIDSGIVWIGPPPGVIEKLGHKGEASRLSKLAGLPIIPETSVAASMDFEDQATKLEEFADNIGWPVLIKPALGGGGQGQVVVRSISEVDAALENALRINASQFKNGDLVFQKYFDDARHIEVQFIADQQGHIVSLGERECSLQRRNQKIIEEAPSPVVTEKMRQELYGHVRKLAQIVGYQSAGTAEFLLSDGKFYFLEVNTRLQVEHGVTEAAVRVHTSNKKKYQLDLFEEMLRIADGHPLGFSQDDVKMERCAVEARLYAEDTEGEFRPAPGDLYFVRFPSGGNVRVDPALYGPEGRVSPSFDPMIAKVISSGHDRKEAISCLKEALTHTIILGIPTNVAFCRELLDLSAIKNGKYNTAFVSKYSATRKKTNPDGLAMVVAAVMKYRDRLASAGDAIYSGRVTSVPGVLNLVPNNSYTFRVEGLGADELLTVFEWASGRYVVSSDQGYVGLRISTIGRNVVSVVLPDGAVREVFAHLHGDVVQLILLGNYYTFTLHSKGEEAMAGDPHAAISGGRVVKVAVRPGDTVRMGDTLFVTEAMKMEAVVKAAFDGRVVACQKQAGDVVASGESIVTIEPMEANAVEIKKEINTSVLIEFPQDATLISKVVARPISLFEDGKIDIHAALKLIRQYYLGYDLPHDSIRTAALIISRAFGNNIKIKKEAGAWTANLLEAIDTIWRLFDEDNVNATVYFAEHLRSAERPIPKTTEGLLLKAVSYYGCVDLRDTHMLRSVVIRIMQAYRCERETKLDILRELIEDFVIERGVVSGRLAQAISSMAMSRIFAQQRELKGACLKALRLLDPAEYYKVVCPPVAMDYLSEYESFLKNPAGMFTPEQHDLMKRAVTKQFDESLHLDTLPGYEAGEYLKRWFASFAMRELPLDETTRGRGIRIFEAMKEVRNGSVEKRLIAIATVNSATPKREADGTVAIPELERAAIDAVRVLKVYSLFGEKHAPNHIFIFAPGGLVLPWSALDASGGGNGLTLASARGISSRVAGFARGINIRSTEVIITLKNEDGEEVRSILEIRHAKELGVISRPPFSVDKREIEEAGNLEKILNEKQYRLGKLLNIDRAKLLFDDGVCEEFFIPGVDDKKGEDGRPIRVGLNLYKGLVARTETIVYAGDFRIQGGALGEPEGKKLVCAVILSYLKQIPLIGIHDGAGANIKASVASLGWAGAYFGAIANTGGFSTSSKFAEWLGGHHEKDFFETTLRHFGVDIPNNEEGFRKFAPLIHIHLNLGATVGMLVYGASISHMSIMADQPEAYRVLTGAATVAKVTGEDATNYELGGAGVHSRISGEIDFAFPTEEAAIDHARKMLTLLNARSGSGSDASILRVADFPQPTLPASAGIILGRDAILANVDSGIFYEMRSNLERSGGVLTGYAALGGRPVMIVASATDYGLYSPRAFKKVALAIGAAQEFRIPLIIATGANWDHLIEAARPESWYQQAEMRRLLAAATVPRFSIALGPRSLEESIHTAVDFICYVKRGCETDFEERRAATICHQVKDTFQDAMDSIAKILGAMDDAKGPDIDSSDRTNKRLRELIPADFTTPYDMRAVIGEIFDVNTFTELWGDDKFSLITGFARLGGRCVGVIADDPGIEGGAQTVYSLSKFTRMNRLCERFGLPIIELNDSPAFKPGSEQEYSGIQTEGGKSIREECLSRNPKIAITLRQNFGGRYIHSNLKTLGPPRKALIVEGARLGVMGPEGAVGVLFGKRLAAITDVKERTKVKDQFIAEYIEKHLSPKTACDLGYAEAIVELDFLRKSIIKILSGQE